MDLPQATHLALIGHGGTYRQALPGFLTNITPAFARKHHLPNCYLIESCTSWVDITF